VVIRGLDWAVHRGLPLRETISIKKSNADGREARPYQVYSVRRGFTPAANWISNWIDTISRHDPRQGGTQGPTTTKKAC